MKTVKYSSIHTRIFSIYITTIYNTVHYAHGVNNKKAELMQRVMHDSGACLKAQCEQNLSSRIPAVNIWSNDYSVSFALTRGRNRSCAADSSKITTFYGVPSLMPLCAGHFVSMESKFMFNVENFKCRLYWSICSDFDSILSWNVCCSPKSSKKSLKTPILALKVIQCHWFWCQSKASVNRFG